MILANNIKPGDRILPIELDGSKVLGGYYPDNSVVVDRIGLGSSNDWMEECRGVPCVFWHNGGGRWPVSHCRKVNQ